MKISKEAKELFYKFVMNKEKLILKYIKLLESGVHDVEFLKKVENIKEYHKNSLETLDPNLIATNGILKTLYHYYRYDKDIYVTRLNSVTEEERLDLENTIETYMLLLSELQQLIIEEEQVNFRLAKIRRIEKLLSPEEIFRIKKRYGCVNEENIVVDSLKR